MESLVRESFYFARWPSLLWFVPLCLAATALLVLYWRRARGPAGLRVTFLLVALRGLVFAILLIYLFQPTLLRQTLQQIPPNVAVLVDRSASMDAKEEGEPRAARVAPLLEGENAPLRRALRAAGKVRYFHFDRRVRPVESESAAGQAENEGTGTDIAGALAEVRELNPGNPAAAIVLLSDGRSNLGPVGAQEVARRAGVPIVAVGFGSRENFRDLQLLDLKAPDLSFIRHETEVSFRLRALGFKGRRVTLVLKSGGQLLATRGVDLDRDVFDERLTFTFRPTEVGLFRLALEVFSQLGEHSRVNNTVDFSMQVLRDKLRVLYVSGRPSWSYRFFRRALKQDPGIDLISFVILRTITDDVNIPQNELSLISFPTERIFTRELHNFDLLILIIFLSAPISRFTTWRTSLSM